MATEQKDLECEEQVCQSKIELFRKLGLGKGRDKPEGKDTPNAPPNEQQECPLDREELGQSTWGLVSGSNDLNTIRTS